MLSLLIKWSIEPISSPIGTVLTYGFTATTSLMDVRRLVDWQYQESRR